MATPNLISAGVQTVGHTIGSSESMTLIVVLAAVIGFLVLIRHLRQPPRFDPTRHLERPPVEHQVTRPLPPASEYVKWEQGQDAEKDDVPWRR